MANLDFRREQEFQEKVVHINRVAKVVKGGRRFSLTALVVVGDGSGKVGYGMGKAKEVPAAISKAIFQAKKNMIMIPMKHTTIPHQIVGKYGAGKVLLKPAAPGTGIIAGGPVRAVMDVAGIKDILAKSLGSANPMNTIRATFNGLENLKDARKVAQIRGVEIKAPTAKSKEPSEETKTETPKTK